MKKLHLILIPILLSSIGFIQAQNTIQESFEKNGEICFQFKVDSQQETDWFSKIISIDNLKDGVITAYANQNEFDRFLKSGKDYKLLPHPNENFNPKMASFDELKNTNAWDTYPTYDAYVAMMYQFETDYPAICDVFSIGQTVNGRDLLVAKISDNINTDEDEPEFFYTSTMHGDETAGYIFMLRLIDSLLTNYGSVQRITGLVNNMEIYINPLANPDGTYNGGNSTVSGAKRTNGNNVDFNRNFPDPEDGPHPDGNAYQPETLAFMAFAENHHFVMSCNMHGGEEVCNYPWDTWYASTKLAADNDWWIHVCREYADTVHAHAPASYMDGFDNGITHGATWYSISGGRQDYMNYFQQCREFTLELSSIKLLPEYQLNTYWGYNRRSFLNYMEQSLYGFRGIVTDANTGQPIKAEVYILNHEEDSSWVYSSLPIGDYHRTVIAGNYDVRYSAPGYIADTVFNLNITNEATIIQDAQLVPVGLMAEFSANTINISPGETIDFTNLSFGNPTSWQWTFEGGTPSSSTLQNPSGILYNTAGVYSVTLSVSDGSGTDTMVKTDYITVADDYLMANTSVATCSGVFYDTGGDASNYSNDEDLTMTFFPAAQNGKIKMDFIEFDVEYQSSCNYDYLQVYDGPNISSPIIGEFCGTNSPGNIISNHSSGALTFVFHSDYSVTRPGWKANISCELEPIVLDLKVFLEGPFNGTNMNPSVSSLLPMSQPFNVSPWNYPGTENVASIPNANIVDWVLIELRDATDAVETRHALSLQYQIARQAAFLLNDGSVVGLDGFSNLSFNQPITQSLYVVVYHRNHLGIMSAVELMGSGGIYSYDFTSPSGQAYGTDSQKNLGGNIYGMFSGDANADNTINDLDKSGSWILDSGLSGYLSSDLNLDGESNNQDKNDFWLPNFGESGNVPE